VIENPKLDKMTDLDAREWVQFAPLIIATLIMGLAPSLVFDYTQGAAQTIVEQFRGAAP
jgi:NADH-quinone oxidoreductase subunit M